MGDISEQLVALRGGLAAQGSAEPVPEIPGIDAQALNRFASASAMYTGSRRAELAGVQCTIHEYSPGRYWLGSISHANSCAPFSPTWLCSAWVIASMAKDAGYAELVDIGSGDGRIAYCARVMGMRTRSIEIDGDLAGLQRQIAQKTGVQFGPECADAAGADICGMSLKNPVFCIGGLAQMGGDRLASAVMDGARRCGIRPGLVLAGTVAKKYPGSSDTAGWGAFARKEGLRVARTVRLPTAWTASEPEPAHYVFADAA